MFKMLTLGLSAALIALGIAGPATASLIYDVNRTIGAGTVTGFLETDGTIGALSNANLVGGEIIMSAPNIAASPVAALFGEDLFEIFAGSIIATETQLLFNFSNNFNSFLVSDNGGTDPTLVSWCLVGASVTCTISTSNIEMLRDGVTETPFQQASRAGDVAIATLRRLPEPAAITLLGFGIAGLLLAARRERRGGSRNGGGLDHRRRLQRTMTEQGGQRP